MEGRHPEHTERHGVVTLHPHLIELYQLLFDYMESLTPRALKAFLADLEARAFPPHEPAAPHIMGQTPVHVAIVPMPEGTVFVAGIDGAVPLWTHTDEVAAAASMTVTPQAEDSTGT